MKRKAKYILPNSNCVIIMENKYNCEIDLQYYLKCLTPIVNKNITSISVDYLHMESFNLGNYNISFNPDNIINNTYKYIHILIRGYVKNTTSGELLNENDIKHYCINGITNPILRLSCSNNKKDQTFFDSGDSENMFQFIMNFGPDVTIRQKYNYYIQNINNEYPYCKRTYSKYDRS